MKRAVWVLAMLFLPSSCLVQVSGWSNGGYTVDLNAVKYGTHDWIAQHALDWLPGNMTFWIRDNLAMYLYGTELPDNPKPLLGDGIGDTPLHHVYYRASGQLQDDASARRAGEACNQVLSYLAAKDLRNAAKWMGVTSHYVCDLAVFGHVMGANTDWGAEKHHSDYEDWVLQFTDQYSTPAPYLKFDASLSLIAPYDATLKLAYDTTFDTSGKGRTCKWMDTNYNTNSAAFKARVEQSLNLAVNTICDLIYTVSTSAGIPEFSHIILVPLITLAACMVLLRAFARRIGNEREKS